MANLKDRKVKGDKFISNIYRSRIDHLLLLKKEPEGAQMYLEIQKMIRAKTEHIKHTLQWCNQCKKLVTESQAETLKCTGTKD